MVRPWKRAEKRNEAVALGVVARNFDRRFHSFRAGISKGDFLGEISRRNLRQLFRRIARAAGNKNPFPTCGSGFRPASGWHARFRDGNARWRPRRFPRQNPEKSFHQRPRQSRPGRAWPPADSRECRKAKHIACRAPGSFWASGPGRGVEMIGSLVSIRCTFSAARAALALVSDPSVRSWRRGLVGPQKGLGRANQRKTRFEGFAWIIFASNAFRLSCPPV